MKNFKLSEFCEREDVDFKKASMLLDEAQDHLMNVMFAKIRYENESLINATCEKMAKSIIDSMNLKRASGRKKSSRGDFYAPCREAFICHAEKSYPNGDGTMTMVFESVEPRPYGNSEEGVKFVQEYRVDQHEFIALFYEVPKESPTAGYKAIPAVIRKIPNLPAANALSNNIFGYLYDIEIKRPVADYRQPSSILSITPCGVIQNAKHEL